MTYLARLVLFVGSYSPLWLMFAIGEWNTKSWVSEISIALLAIGIGGIIYIINFFSKLAKSNFVANLVRARDDQTMSYVAAYIIPFALTDFNQSQQTLQLMVFFIVLGAIYVNSAMIHINPTLNMLGYKIVEIIDCKGRTLILITRNDLGPKSRFQAVQMNGDVYLES